MIGEYTDTGATLPGAIKRSYTWGLDIVHTREKAGGVGALLQIADYVGSKGYFPAYDGNGNVVSLFDGAPSGGSAGARVAAYEYSPFGELLRSEGSYAAENPVRFSTKFTDDENGLVYYGRRYYSPLIGRFHGRDPIEEQGGTHLYAFVRNNPTNSWDYLGMFDDGMCWDPLIMTHVPCGTTVGTGMDTSGMMSPVIVSATPVISLSPSYNASIGFSSSAAQAGPGGGGATSTLNAAAVATDWGKTQFGELPQKLKDSLCAGFLSSDPATQSNTYGKQATVDGIDFFREQSVGLATYSDGSTREHSRDGPLLGQDRDGNWFQLDAQTNTVTSHTPFPPGTGYSVPSIFPAQSIRTDQIGSDGLGVQTWLTGVYSFHTHPAAPNVASGVSGPDRSSTNLWKPPVIAQGSPSPGGYPAFGGAFDGGRKVFYGSDGKSDFEISFDDVRKALGCK